VKESNMNLAAQRTIAPAKPGPRPPPKHLSARALAALVSQLTTGYANNEGPEEWPGPFDPYLRRGGEGSLLGGGPGTH
jgi:hypothetical protein